MLALNWHEDEDIKWDRRHERSHLLIGAFELEPSETRIKAMVKQSIRQVRDPEELTRFGDRLLLLSIQVDQRLGEERSRMHHHSSMSRGFVP